METVFSTNIDCCKYAMAYLPKDMEIIPSVGSKVRLPISIQAPSRVGNKTIEALEMDVVAVVFVPSSKGGKTYVHIELHHRFAKDFGLI